MSVQAITWVLGNSKAKGSTRCVLLAIANYADTSGGVTSTDCLKRPSRPRLAKEAAVSLDTFDRAVRTLAELGELVVQRGERRGNRNLPNAYRILMPTESLKQRFTAADCGPEVELDSRTVAARSEVLVPQEPSVLGVPPTEEDHKVKSEDHRAQEVVARFVESRTESGATETPGRARARIGAEAKRMLGEGVQLEELLKAAAVCGEHGWATLRVEVDKIRAANRPVVYRDPLDVVYRVPELSDW